MLVQVLLTVALVAGVIMIAVAAVFNSEVSIKNLTPLFYPGKDKVSGIMAVMAVAPWAFVGFDTVPQAAEEFDFSPKKTKIIMVVSIIFGAAVYIILNTITALVTPKEYDTWNAYIDNVPNLKGIESLPTFFAAKELLGNIGVFSLGIAVVAAVLSGIIGFYMATSRLLYSMAKEEVLPKWFGKIHKQYQTPENAIFFIMCISVIAPFFGRTVLGWLVDMSSLGAAIGYGYTSAATFILAKRNKEYRIMLTGSIGVIMSVVFSILLLVPVKGIDCSLSVESYICLFIWGILGILFYTRSRQKN